MSSIEIPDKTYFKIGEVAKLLELEPYVLRYWETEFDVLSPQKTRSGQRSYQRPDIELLNKIQRLLYEEMYTIAGARRQLQLERDGELERVDPKQIEDLREAKVRLKQRAEDLEEEVEKTRRSAERQTGKVEELQKERREMQARIDSLEAAAMQAAQLDMIPGDDVVETVEALEEELVNARQRIAELQDERDALMGQVRSRRRQETATLSELRQQLRGIAQIAGATH